MKVQASPTATSFRRVSTSASEALVSYRKFQKNQEKVASALENQMKEHSPSRASFEKYAVGDSDNQLKKNSLFQSKFLIHTQNNFVSPTTLHNEQNLHGGRGDPFLKSVFLQETQNRMILGQDSKEPFIQSKTYFQTHSKLQQEKVIWAGSYPYKGDHNDSMNKFVDRSVIDKSMEEGRNSVIQKNQDCKVDRMHLLEQLFPKKFKNANH